MDSLDAHLGENKLTLEWFSLPFASPNTQDEGNLKNVSFEKLLITFPQKYFVIIETISKYTLMLGRDMKFLVMWTTSLSMKAGAM